MMKELIILTKISLIIACMIVIPLVSANASKLTHAITGADVLQIEHKDVVKALNESPKLGADSRPFSFLRMYRNWSPEAFTGTPPFTPDVLWTPVSDEVIMIEVPVGNHAASPANDPQTPVLLFYDE